MWIRTQTEDALYQVNAVRAVKNVTERSYSVVGTLIGTKEPVVLGEYAVYEEALQEINAIEFFLISNPSGVYHIQLSNQEEA